MVDEEAQARVGVWKYAFGFINTRVVKCAIELEIPDVLEKHRGPMTLSELCSAVGCSRPFALYRIMRFLVHQGIFKRAEPTSKDQDELSVYYAQTALSRLLTRDNMAPFILLHGTPPGGGITSEALKVGKESNSKAAAHGEDIWTDAAFGKHKKAFTDAMVSHARVTVSSIIDNYPEAFKEIGSLVDVGGRHGAALGMLVKAFPWIRGISFDLPQIVYEAPPLDGVEYIGGSMFEIIPKADAVMLMWILHDWSDDLCIEILKKCKEAVPSEMGKVMIIDAIIDENGEGDEYTGARLALDMVMMATTVEGKERTYREWTHLLNAAGFSRHKVKNIKTIESVIVAYP